MVTSADDFRYLGIALGITISVAGFLGNSLAIAAYLSNKRIRTTFNKLVVNLALVDFIISTIILPMIIYGYYATEWPFPPVTCSIFAYFYYASHYTSAAFLVVISFNRFLRVARPHSNYRAIFSVKGRRIIGACAWSFSLVCLLPLLFTNGFGWWQNGLICTFSRINPFSDVYSMIMRVLFQLFPLLCMMVLYGMIFYTVRKSHASVDNPKITVSGCDSFAASNDTRATTGTPGRTPSRNSVKQLSFKRQISYDLTSPSTRSTVLMTPDCDLKLNWKPSFPSLNEENSQKKTKLNEVVTQIVSNDDNGDYKIVKLQRSPTNIQHAEICKTGAADENVTLPHVPQPLQKPTAPQHLHGLRSRSVTFSNFTDVLNQSSTRISFDVRNKLQLPESIDEQLKPPEAPRRHLYTPQRPRLLSISPDYQANNNSVSPNKIRRRSNTTSLPNLERSRSISTSFSNMMDFVRQQKERRKLRRSVQHAKAQRKLLYMCITICSAFALCSLPSLFLNLATDYDSASAELHMVMTNVSWLTSMINPIVYAAMNAQFRREYSRLLRKISSCLLRSKSNEGTVKVPASKSNYEHSGNNISTMKATMKASESLTQK